MVRVAVPACVMLAAAASIASAGGYQVDYSTYLGGSDWEHARDIINDSAGFTYVVGGTGSGDFTGASSFPGANTYNAGQPITAADAAFRGADVFVTKLNQAGQVQWTKYIGGQNYDRAYAIEADNAGNLIVGGRAGVGYPTTASLQTDFAGTNNPSNYGRQNGFVTKLNAAGQVQWSTYLGTGELVRDVAVDKNGDVYVPLTMAANSSRDFTSANAPASLKSYFNGKFMNTPPTTNTRDVGVAKIDGATGQLEWARWIGGTGEETTNPSIRVNDVGEAYLLVNTTSTSTSLPAVGVGVQANNGGGTDMYLAKFNAEGTGLVYGTYLGGSGTEAHETHALALDQNGNAVVTNHTSSGNYPVTPGALNLRGGASDIGITRFDANGVRTISAIIGGNSSENPDGIYVDATGRIYITGETGTTDLPVTADALQKTNAGSQDAFMMVLSPDLTTIEYLSYFGGTGSDNGRTMFLGANGTIYMAGGTLSTNFPTANAADGSFNGGSHQFAPSSGDAWIAKFTVVPEPASLGLILGAGLLLARRPFR